MIATNRTVREVALEHPQATEVFEQFKIDYCCGGNTPLDQACANAGVDVETVLRLLAETDREAGEAARDFQKASLPELITHILEQHHVYTKQEIARLPALFEKVLAAHGRNHPELERADAVFTEICDDLKPHMFKEEQILFPYLLVLAEAAAQQRRPPASPFGTVKNPVRMMMREHDLVGDLLRDLRAITSDYVVPADACTSFRVLYQSLAAFEKDLHQHIHLENNVLFPRAVEIEESLS